MAPGTEPSVRDVMRHEVPVASPTTPIAELARLMVEYRVPGLPVIGQGELVGIVTEADLIQREATIDMPSIVTFLDAVIVADAGTPFEEELRRVVARQWPNSRRSCSSSRLILCRSSTMRGRSWGSPREVGSSSLSRGWSHFPRPKILAEPSRREDSGGASCEA